jgi:hypothetical protein
MDSHVNNGAHLRIMELIWESWNSFGHRGKSVWDCGTRERIISLFSVCIDTLMFIWDITARSSGASWHLLE